MIDFEKTVRINFVHSSYTATSSLVFSSALAAVLEWRYMKFCNQRLHTARAVFGLLTVLVLGLLIYFSYTNVFYLY